MTTIPDTPRLRDVLDRGDDPADYVGGFEYLIDIVMNVADTPLEERDARSVRMPALVDWMINEPIPMADGTVSYLPNPVHTATTYRWEAELLEDVDLLGRLIDTHPRGFELEERMRSLARFNTLTVGVIGETDEDRGFSGECEACSGPLLPGDRALMIHEVLICLPCLRRATEGVDLG